MGLHTNSWRKPHYFLWNSPSILCFHVFPKKTQQRSMLRLLPFVFFSILPPLMLVIAHIWEHSFLHLAATFCSMFRLQILWSRFRVFFCVCRERNTGESLVHQLLHYSNNKIIPFSLSRGVCTKVSNVTGSILGNEEIRNEFQKQHWKHNVRWNSPQWWNPLVSCHHKKRLVTCLSVLQLSVVGDTTDREHPFLCWDILCLN